MPYFLCLRFALYFNNIGCGSEEKINKFILFFSHLALYLQTEDENEDKIS